MKANKPIATTSRPPSGDDAECVPSVIRVSIGGRDEWDALELSLFNQLIEHGAKHDDAEHICAVLRRAYLKWAPGQAVLIDEADRHTALPRCEELAAIARVTIRGLFFEILRREIEKVKSERILA